MEETWQFWAPPIDERGRVRERKLLKEEIDFIDFRQGTLLCSGSVMSRRGACYVSTQNLEKASLSLCSIVIVTHNNLECTKQCLESIIKITEYNPYELIVVDAHSTDGTLEYLRSEPEVRVVSLEKNFPYSYSINRGIQVAKGEYLCFINNDVIIVQSKWLAELVHCAQSDARIGIVGPKQCNKDLSVNSAGRNILPDGSHVLIWPPDNTLTSCTYVVGACFLVKRQLVDQIGLFDENYFFSYDETDYCLRAWKAGRKVVCDTASMIVHLGSKTLKAVTDNDYEYDVHNYQDPEKRFYKTYSSRDFEMALRQSKGLIRFYLWKIHYKNQKLDKAVNLVGEGIETIREEGLRVFLRKTSDFVLHRGKFSSR